MTRKTLALALMLLTMTAQAQETKTEAERAAEAARKAAAAAADARREAAGEQRLASEDFWRIAEEQERAKKAEKDRKEHKTRAKSKNPEADSLRWVANQMKLKTWNYQWFAGGNLSVNFSFADNVTDHPPFRYFGDALGLGVEGYVGRYFSKKFGMRVGRGYHNVKNRVDRESVDEGWRHMKMTPAGGGEPVPIYTGNGFFRFGVMELYTDAIFDVSGLSSARHFRPLHVHIILGVGMLASGKKKLKDEGLMRSIPRYAEEGNNKGWLTKEDGSPWFPSFENRVKPSSHVGIAGRAGIMFDYRFSKSMSANFELTGSVTDDRFEGIKYDEPFDILLKLSGGLKWHF
jgi:hypothetical protein